jgi:hypothetical protein
VEFLLGFFGLVSLAGGLVLAYYAWRNFQASSLVSRPLSRVAKLRPGRRKVRGQIAPIGKPLLSPVTNKPCVYYRLRVYEEKKTWKSKPDPGIVGAFVVGGAVGAILYNATASTGRLGDNATYSWHPILDDDVSIPLVVEDETGAVEVDLRGATIIPKEKARIMSDMLHPAPASLTDLLLDEYEIHQVDRAGRARTLHYVEEALLVGAKVTVVGAVDTLKNGDVGFRRKDDTLLVSERDLSKEGRAARGRAMGFSAGAGAALAVGLGMLSGAFIIFVRALLVGR